MSDLEKQFAAPHTADKPADQRQFLSGVYCDIMGTLIRRASPSGLLGVDDGIRGYLRAQAAMRRPITLISKIPGHAEVTPQTGLIKEFGDVQPKLAYRNALLEELIDDAPEFSGLMAVKHIDPRTPQAKQMFARYYDRGREEFEPPPPA